MSLFGPTARKELLHPLRDLNLRHRGLSLTDLTGSDLLLVSVSRQGSEDTVRQQQNKNHHDTVASKIQHWFVYSTDSEE